MHTLYTLGYTGIKPETIYQAAATRKVLIVDTRYRAQSRHPQWNRNSLSKLLGKHYVHLPALGNINYKSGGDIVIAEPAKGIPFVVQRLNVQPVILMCACADFQICHRQVVANMVNQECGCIIVHLEAQSLQSWLHQPKPQQLLLI